MPHPKPKKYLPKNIPKYEGNPYDIVARSSWERRLMIVLDSNPSVISWSSETIVIPYLSPLDNKVHRYFVDFKAKVKQKDGTVKTLLIEVKPHDQTQKPKPPKTNHHATKKRLIKESVVYVKNQAKWNAAKEYAESRGWEFVIFTEHHLGLKNSKNGKDHPV